MVGWREEGFVMQCRREGGVLSAIASCLGFGGEGSRNRCELRSAQGRW